MLCQAAPSCNQLPQEEVWTHKPVAAKEEDQIDDLSGLMQAALHMQLLVFVGEVPSCKWILTKCCNGWQYGVVASAVHGDMCL